MISCKSRQETSNSLKRSSVLPGRSTAERLRGGQKRQGTTGACGFDQADRASEGQRVSNRQHSANTAPQAIRSLARTHVAVGFSKTADGEPNLLAERSRVRLNPVFGGSVCPLAALGDSRLHFTDL